MNAQERAVMQAALDALDNHPGNYKLSDKQCDAYDAISKTIRATLAVPALPLAAPVTDAEVDAAFDALDLLRESTTVPEIRRALEGFAAGRAVKVWPAALEPGWISVNERLPEIGRTPVLVAVAWRKYYENEDGSPAYSEGIDVTEGEYVPGFCDRAGYMESYQGTHGDSSAVTHWMPLPPAPGAAAPQPAAPPCASKPHESESQASLLIKDVRQAGQAAVSQYGGPELQALVLARLAVPQSAVVEQAWQGIETAPKHTEVLVWRDDSGSFIAKLTTPDAVMTTEELERNKMEFSDDFEEWWSDAYGWQEGGEKPTHWMLLPSPPVDTKGGES